MTETSFLRGIERVGRNRFENYIKYLNENTIIMSDKDVILLWEIINRFNENRTNAKYSILNKLGGKNKKETNDILVKEGYHFVGKLWDWNESGTDIIFTNEEINHDYNEE